LVATFALDRDGANGQDNGQAGRRLTDITPRPAAIGGNGQVAAAHAALGAGASTVAAATLGASTRPALENGESKETSRANRNDTGNGNGSAPAKTSASGGDTQTPSGPSPQPSTGVVAKSDAHDDWDEF